MKSSACALRTVLLAVLAAALASAYAPTSAAKFSTMKRSSFVVPRHHQNNNNNAAAARSAVLLEMANDAEEAEPKKNADGTLYDDEVAPYVDPLSDSMRERLKREASTGLDPNAKQTNVILYIGIAVVILVALGGKDILF